jgi:hypothetical protein
MAIVFQDDWTGTNGAAWDTSKWTTGVNNTSVLDIQSNQGRLAVGGAGYANGRALATMDSLTDQRIELEFSFPSIVEMYPLIYLRHDGAWSPTNFGDAMNGYNVVFQPVYGENITLEKKTGGVNSTLAVTAFTYSSSVTYKFLFECVGTTLRAKLWPAASSEPTEWTVTAEDTSGSPHLSGVAAISKYSGAPTTTTTMFVDNLFVDDLQGDVSPKQYARPISSAIEGGWSMNAGSIALAVGTEATDDSTYVQSPLSPANAATTVNLGSIQTPEVRTGHIVRYRYYKANGMDRIDLTVGLYQSGTLIAEQTIPSIASVVTAGQFTLTEQQAESITNYGALQLRFTANEVP